MPSEELESSIEIIAKLLYLDYVFYMQFSGYCITTIIFDEGLINSHQLVNLYYSDINFSHPTPIFSWCTHLTISTTLASALSGAKFVVQTTIYRILVSKIICALYFHQARKLSIQPKTWLICRCPETIDNPPQQQDNKSPRCMSHPRWSKKIGITTNLLETLKNEFCHRIKSVKIYCSQINCQWGQIRKIVWEHGVALFSQPLTKTNGNIKISGRRSRIRLTRNY